MKVSEKYDLIKKVALMIDLSWVELSWKSNKTRWDELMSWFDWASEHIESLGTSLSIDLR